MTDDTSAFAGLALSDVLSFFSIPGAGIAGAGLQKLLGRRAQVARDILMDELRRGNVTPATMVLEDDAAAFIFRYIRAAEEGTARLNLRLMAQVIAGQHQHPTLTADEFLYHASIVASLRREEIILLGTVLRHWLANGHELDGVVRNRSALQAAKAALIPSHFLNDDELTATMAAITRTGLLVPGSAFGSIAYNVSPLLERLNALASFETAIRNEDHP
jgi:hypothetical protein